MSLNIYDKGGIDFFNTAFIAFVNRRLVSADSYKNHLFSNGCISKEI